MTTLGSSVQPLGNLLPGHDLHDHLRAVPPAIAPHADPLNFCSPRIADPWDPCVGGGPAAPRYDAGCTVTSTRGSLPAATAGM